MTVQHKPGDVEICQRCGGEQIYQDNLPNPNGTIYFHLPRHNMEDCLIHLKAKLAELENNTILLMRLLAPEENA